MHHPQGHKPTHIPPHIAAAGYQHNNYSEQRSPQYNISNESASSIAERRVARDESGRGRAYTLGAYDNDGDFDLIFPDEATASGPPSDTTGSEDTVVNGALIRRTAGIPAVPGSALTQGNIDLHDRVFPLGTMTTYQWIWGQPCPGGFDAKDTSSKDSMKVHVSHSHASQVTENLENEYGVVNHPSESFIAFAGVWADVAAGPTMLDELAQLN